ncbi:MAG: hypothetical protein ACP5OG_02260 [Candidatus Nanoarchaeia archaeon]
MRKLKINSLEKHLGEQIRVITKTKKEYLGILHKNKNSFYIKTRTLSLSPVRTFKNVNNPPKIKWKLFEEIKRKQIKVGNAVNIVYFNIKGEPTRIHKYLLV